MDLVDRDIDDQVERTRSRPLPSGKVTPNQVIVFIFIQAFAGLVVLLQFNWFAVALGTASLLVVAIYPFMKRITDWAAACSRSGLLLGRIDGMGCTFWPTGN